MLLAGTAQAAPPRTSADSGRPPGIPAVKKPKKLKGKKFHAYGPGLELYAGCAHYSPEGCIFETYSKTKVWTFSEFAPLEEPYGPYEEFKEKYGKKTYTYAYFYYYYDECVIATEKVKGSYYGGYYCPNSEGYYEEIEPLDIIK
ncbi:MAG TPA: hypothetical protein VMB51_00135 [Solirubrobacteraceae bacterium]|nr:hypothetical protein [Solirubrobacteraceae bacterium]